MMVLPMHLVLFTSCICLKFEIGYTFLWDKKMEILQSDWSDSPVVLRHVEFIGEVDNGTLDCFVPGVREYKWTLLSKGSTGGPFTSTITLGVQPFLKTAWSVEIYPAVFDGEILVAMCEPRIEYTTQLRVIWVITKLHSPLGYPTDPRICDFGSSDIKKNCLWYWWKFRTDCYYDRGQEYRGSVRKTASNKLCYSWENAKPGEYSDNKYIDHKGNHNYCRNPLPDSKRIPWCYYYNPKTEQPEKHSCTVDRCSDCMYGNGNGKFNLYPARTFPKYTGGTLDTFKADKQMKIVKCFHGKRLNNLCRLHEGVTGPHCYTPTNLQDVKGIDKVPHPKLELTKCTVSQCTVRQVWFLFINSFGNPYLLESNNEAVSIVLIQGRRNAVIKFAAFGVHKLDGISIDTQTSSLKTKVKHFKITAFRSPPSGLSTLEVPHVDKTIEGEYFLKYEFAEADTKVQQNHFKGKFKLKVEKSTTFKVIPSLLKVCRGEKAIFKLDVEGGFKPVTESIRWSYGSHRTSISNVISIDDAVREISSDLRSLTIAKSVQEIWIGVEGNSYSGRTKAIAQLKIKVPPLLKSLGPRTTYADRGGQVTMSLQTNNETRLHWVFEAQHLSEIPDDPSLAFQDKTDTDGKFVQSLVITDVMERHYGLYEVTSEREGCRTSVRFYVKHPAEKPLVISPTPVNESLAGTWTYSASGLSDCNKTLLSMRPSGNSSIMISSINASENGTFLKSANNVSSLAVLTSGDNSVNWCFKISSSEPTFFEKDLGTCSKITGLATFAPRDSNTLGIDFFYINSSATGQQWNQYSEVGKLRYFYHRAEDFQVFHRLRSPLVTRYIRIVPRYTNIDACMRVQVYGCLTSTLECSEQSEQISVEDVVLFFAILGGVIAIILALVYCVRTIKSSSKQETEGRTKKKQNKKKMSKKLKKWIKDKTKNLPIPGNVNVQKQVEEWGQKETE